MSKIKVKISETKYGSFYKTLRKLVKYPYLVNGLGCALMNVNSHDLFIAEFCLVLCADIVQSENKNKSKKGNLNKIKDRR